MISCEHAGIELVIVTMFFLQGRVFVRFWGGPRLKIPKDSAGV